MSENKYIPGDGCKCYAKSWNECGCDGVDWRSKREVELEAHLELCRKALEPFTAEHFSEEDLEKMCEVVKSTLATIQHEDK